MMMISNCHKIVGGTAEGKTMITTQPINFLAMVDAKTGIIADPQHPLNAKSVKGAVLIFPYSIGSSVGAYAIYALKEYGTIPSAMICSKADIITASGCAITNIPLVDLPKGIELSALRQGLIARVEADEGRIMIKA